MYIWEVGCSLGRKYTSTHAGTTAITQPFRSTRTHPSIPAPSQAMPSSTSTSHHATPVQSPRSTVGGNAGANQTAHATRPYTNIVACNGTLSPATHITATRLTHHRLLRHPWVLWPQSQALEFHGGACRAKRGAGRESSLGGDDGVRGLRRAVLLRASTRCMIGRIP